MSACEIGLTSNSGSLESRPPKAEKLTIRLAKHDDKSAIRLGIVYFVHCGKANRLKIGYTWPGIKSRLAGLSTGASVQLSPLGYMWGDTVVESAIHRKFQSLRKGGEWFQFTDKLKRFVTESAIAISPGRLSPENSWVSRDTFRLTCEDAIRWVEGWKYNQASPVSPKDHPEVCRDDFLRSCDESPLIPDRGDGGLRKSDYHYLRGAPNDGCKDRRAEVVKEMNLKPEPPVTPGKPKRIPGVTSLDRWKNPSPSRKSILLANMGKLLRDIETATPPPGYILAAE